MKTISCEPNWQGMFKFAIAIAGTEIPKDKVELYEAKALLVSARDHVAEMLQAGKDLHAANKTQSYCPECFDLALSIIRQDVPKDRGQETVAIMLDYGKRLHAARDKKGGK